MELFAHHTIEHSLTSNIYYFGVALAVLGLAIWIANRGTKE
jgi:hypothetical protein